VLDYELLGFGGVGCLTSLPRLKKKRLIFLAYDIYVPYEYVSVVVLVGSLPIAVVQRMGASSQGMQVVSARQVLQPHMPEESLAEA
jgi:hypothetical protein